MNFRFVVFLLFVSIHLTAQRSRVIPAPASVEFHDGSFVIDGQLALKNDGAFDVSVDFLRDYLSGGYGMMLDTTGERYISFVYDSTLSHKEGYELIVSKHDIRIKARSDVGAFYATQTLRQLLPTCIEDHSCTDAVIEIECQHIIDYPRFTYRGMHLDVGRHFFPVSFIKKYIDALAFLKLNTFHWHLTEDQGWRIEIKKYPRLQKVAAYRDETLIGHSHDKPHTFDGTRYGGYYTQEEVREIVAYAQRRHVTVVPEIELPGHSQAAIAAYPYLGCFGDSVKVATKWGIFKDIYCTHDSTFEFLEDVLDEVLELFPSKYVHIGGDEAPKKNWKKCRRCQDRITSEKLKDEHELQSYFVTRIEKYLNAKGRQIIGWDEILEGGLAPNATVMSWRGTKGAVEAARQHHNVIMTPTSHCYFDHYQSEVDGEPLAIGGYLPLEKVYGFDPIPDELNAEESKYVLGAQGNVWTEYMPTSRQVEYMAFPRMLAMSEVNWTMPDQKDLKNFMMRVEHFHHRLDALDIQYANHLHEIKDHLNNNDDVPMLKLTKHSSAGDIYYTLDGTVPTASSIRYSDGIRLTHSAHVKVAAFIDGSIAGPVFSKTYERHKAVGKQISINVPINKKYSGSGIRGLINGFEGEGHRFDDAEWLGFRGEDLEIVIDLGESVSVSGFTTRFFDRPSWWVHAPQMIEYKWDDGQYVKLPVDRSDKEGYLVNVKAMVATSMRARYLHLKIPGLRSIPDNLPGEGQKAWLFIDEIRIE